MSPSVGCGPAVADPDDMLVVSIADWAAVVARDALGLLDFVSGRLDTLDEAGRG
jgi:hypothetical protein